MLYNRYLNVDHSNMLGYDSVLRFFILALGILTQVILISLNLPGTN